MVKTLLHIIVSLVLVLSGAASYAQGVQSQALHGDDQTAFSAAPQLTVAVCYGTKTLRQRQTVRQLERKSERNGKSAAASPLAQLVCTAHVPARANARLLAFSAGSFAAHNKYKNLTAFLQTVV